MGRRKEPLTEGEAREQGFTVDKGEEPIGYKGPRFDPTETVDIITVPEHRLRVSLETMRKMLVTLNVVATDAEPNGIEILAAAEHWLESRKPTGAIVELSYRPRPAAGKYARADVLCKAACPGAGVQIATVAEVVDHGNPNPGIYFYKTTPLGLAEKICRLVRENLP